MRTGHVLGGLRFRRPYFVNLHRGEHSAVDRQTSAIFALLGRKLGRALLWPIGLCSER